MEVDYGRVLVWGGASVLLCAIINALIRLILDRKPASETSSNITVDKPEKEKNAEDVPSDSEKPTKLKKRPAWKGKTDYSHPWLIKSLKGHTGAVLHMDFSSNGKYLASTCEDLAVGKPPPPPHSLPPPPPMSLLGPPPHGLPLPPPPSMMQMQSPLAVLTLLPPPAPSPQQQVARSPPPSPPSSRQDPPPPPLSRRSPPPSRNRKTRARLRTSSPVSPARLSTDELVATLRPYLLSRQQMFQIGYPVEMEPNSCKASFYVSPPPRVRPVTFLDVSAPEFVPAAGGTPDSGHGSGNVSPLNDSDEEHDGAEEHVCVRCDSLFRIGSDGEYITEERCVFHWGRLTDGVMNCCGKTPGAEGCTNARLHVWNGTKPGLNGPLDGYVRARARRGGVFAIDTEMCYTTKGLELVSVAFVRPDGQLAYKTNVRPCNPVICANTRFSGVRLREIDRASKTLRDVQNDILGFVGADTVLMGHALENDLRALKLLHTAVVDTCALYPHARGFPMRRSLRVLCSELLQREVQVGTHSPVEDARAALDLVLLRAHADRARAATSAARRR